MRREEEGVDVASSHAASDTPQKRDCHISPKQANPKMAGASEAYSPRTCARKNWDGETLRQRKSGCCQ